MAEVFYKIKNKIPELAYAFTPNGVELPVLDITHPYFVSCTDEKILQKLLPYVEKNAEKNARKFNKIPSFIKRFLSKRSFAMAELLQGEGENSFASGITTLMMKLGPRLIGKGKKRFWDRQVNKGFGALVIRMRVRDISKCQKMEEEKVTSVLALALTLALLQYPERTKVATNSTIYMDIHKGFALLKIFDFGSLL